MSARGLGLSAFQGAWAAAGAVGLVAAALGVLLGVAQWGLVRGAARFGWQRRWSSVTDRDRSGDRNRVVAFHSAVGATIAAVLLVTAAFHAWLSASSRIQVASLRTALLVGFVGFLVCAAVLLQAMLRPLLLRAFGFLDRRLGLPFPPQRSAQWFLYAFGPACLLLLPPFWLYGRSLGVLGLASGAALLVVAVGLLERVLSDLSGWSALAKVPSWGRWLTCGGALLLALAGALHLDRWDEGIALTANASVLPFAVGTLQKSTDLDRDGSSSLFGGGDCAPLDASRSPAARDVPANSIDEDCDGEDAGEQEDPSAIRTYYGKLTPQQQRPYNVLWVMVDALRAKSMSLYGYERETTPFLSNLAKEAWVFDNAYSQSSNTSLSAPSMFSGRNPASIDWRQGKYYPEPKEGHVVIAQVASQVDYSTSIAVNYRVRWRLPGMLTGHETIRTAPKSESWHSGEYTVLNTIKGIAAARSENKPFFATAHFDDVHQPYVGGNDHAVPKFGHRDKAVAGYDRGIAAFDNMLQILVDHLRNEELWEETILVVTSDHGEEFGEHGERFHSTSCHVESVHVPLIVRVPGFAPARVSHPVGLVDIVPTLQELLQLPQNSMRPDGQSLLLPVLSPGEVREDRPVFCSIYQVFANRDDFFIRSVRSGKHAFMHDMLSGKKKLFDLEEDPGEQHDLLAEDDHNAEAGLEAMLKASLKSNIFQARTLN
ncbi:MAG: sulfatase-like hydrolase/transferase [Deltaproteobacteria bacterium]|nr:sulfatase-like hydrolase/transferase [Deltaproteobacteria bacterium]